MLHSPMGLCTADAVHFESIHLLLPGARGHPLFQPSDRCCYGVTIYSNVSIESIISLPQMKCDGRFLADVLCGRPIHCKIKYEVCWLCMCTSSYHYLTLPFSHYFLFASSYPRMFVDRRRSHWFPHLRLLAICETFLQRV
jgi:hypothetical protein